MIAWRHRASAAGRSRVETATVIRAGGVSGRGLTSGSQLHKVSPVMRSGRLACGSVGEEETATTPAADVHAHGRDRPPAPRASVSVVVVSYNGRRVLGSCLDAVAASGREIVVVDNASPDGSAAFVRTHYPAVELIALDRNLGYGAAANIGIPATAGRYVLLLNADAWPVGDAIDRLIESAEAAPRAGLLGPRLVGGDGAPRRSVIRQPGRLGLPLWTLFPRLGTGGYGAWRRLGSVEEVRRSEFVIGAALLLRREALAEVGGFDERFFMYNEDVDLCVRLRHAGWQARIVPSATFVHLGGVSSRPIQDEMYRELLRSHLGFRAKYGSARDADTTRRLLVAALRLRAAAGGGEADRRAADWLAASETAELLESHA